MRLMSLNLRNWDYEINQIYTSNENIYHSNCYWSIFVYLLNTSCTFDHYYKIILYCADLTLSIQTFLMIRKYNKTSYSQFEKSYNSRHCLHWSGKCIKVKKNHSYCELKLPINFRFTFGTMWTIHWKNLNYLDLNCIDIINFHVNR